MFVNFFLLHNYDVESFSDLMQAVSKLFRKKTQEGVENTLPLIVIGLKHFILPTTAAFSEGSSIEPGGIMTVTGFRQP